MVTAEIQKIIKQKEAGILSGTQAMKKLLEQLQQQVQFNIALGSKWDVYTNKKTLESIKYQIKNYEKKSEAEAAGQINKMWGMGQNLIDIPLRMSGIYLGMPHISASMLDTLGSKEFMFAKISGVYADAYQKIKGELTVGLMGGKTPAEVAKAIGENLTDPGIFRSIAERAEVITQTEMGRAFSTASDMRMAQAAQYVPELMKVWIHAGHPMKPRPTHLMAHGQVVPASASFNVGGVAMKYPKDPNAPIEEVIRCGCISQPWMQSWGGKPDKGFELPRKLKAQRAEMINNG